MATVTLNLGAIEHGEVDGHIYEYAINGDGTPGAVTIWIDPGDVATITETWDGSAHSFDCDVCHETESLHRLFCRHISTFLGDYADWKFLQHKVTDDKIWHVPFMPTMDLWTRVLVTGDLKAGGRQVFYEVAEPSKNIHLGYIHEGEGLLSVREMIAESIQNEVNEALANGGLVLICTAPTHTYPHEQNLKKAREHFKLGSMDRQTWIQLYMLTMSGHCYDCDQFINTDQDIPEI